MKAELVVIIVLAVVIALLALTKRKNKEGFNEIRETIAQKYNVRYSPTDFTLPNPLGGRPVASNKLSHRYGDSMVDPTQGSLQLVRPNGTILTSFVNAPIQHNNVQIPSIFIDWITKGWLLKVRDQYQCGDCWSFAISEMMAQRLCLLTQGKFQVPMSAQYLCSCYYGTQGAGGCTSGVPEPVMTTISQYGTVPESYYPYQEVGGIHATLPCKAPSANTPTYFLGKVNPLCIQSPNGPPDANQLNLSLTLDRATIDHNVQQMKTDIYLNGPITVAIMIYNDFYSFVPTQSNVYIPDPSSGAVGGHAIVVVGWNVTNGISHWIVQNSWGSQWGYGLDNYNKNNSKGGYWNHIMGRNAAEIEGFSVSAMPAINDPGIQAYLPSTTSQYTKQQLAAWSGTGSQTLRALAL